MSRTNSDPRKRPLVSDPAQIRLLSSSVRQELVDTLSALGGEAEIAQLAEHLGRPADGLYYHMRMLDVAGLVREVPGTAGHKQRFRLAEPGGFPLRLGYDLGPQGNGPELLRFAKAMLQVAGSDFENAITDDAAITEGPERTLWASRNKGWLSPAELAEVNGLLERLSELVSQPRNGDRQTLVSFAFVLAPVRSRPKRRVSRASSTG
ncbi:helix-turn-helix domain-containing protein [Novosphingobium sp.]|uniref:winged helix-turn-helix domain-containing protein n=1 Tax=Novosphingobium sp. TaxID=1874826 RepID=UPI0025FFCDC0|nr:helix-turn-helix domain-containing protein [Novosphingobium sp.]MCC6926082.1 helix-turn-helix transcriptional regulator [Novosphingobium sp.]